MNVSHAEVKTLSLE